MSDQSQNYQLRTLTNAKWNQRKKGIRYAHEILYIVFMIERRWNHPRNHLFSIGVAFAKQTKLCVYIQDL